jgi:putative glutathione S-transferase
MSLLIDGKWHDHWYDTEKTGGWFVRNESVFRRQVSAAATSQFAAEFGGYHLYVSLGRSLHEGPSARSTGAFRTQFLPPVIFTRSMIKADPRYTGRVTVPVLWDTTRHHRQY